MHKTLTAEAVVAPLKMESLPAADLAVADLTDRHEVKVLLIYKAFTVFEVVTLRHQGLVAIQYT